MQETSPSESIYVAPPKTDTPSLGSSEIHNRGEVQQPLETQPQPVAGQTDASTRHENGTENGDTYMQRLARSFGVSPDENSVSHSESEPLSPEQYTEKLKYGMSQMAAETGQPPAQVITEAEQRPAQAVAETGQPPTQELTARQEVSDNSNATKTDAVLEQAQQVLDTLAPGAYVLNRDHVEIVSDPSGGPTRFNPASDKIYINIEQSLQNGESPERIAARTALSYVHEAQLAKYYAEEQTAGSSSLTEQAYVDRRLDQKAEALALTFDAQRQLENVQRAQGSEATLDVLNMPHTNDLDDIAARYSSIVDTQGRAAGVEMLREELQDGGQLRVPTHDFQQESQQEHAASESYEQRFRDNWREMPPDPEHPGAHIVEERSDTYMPKRDKNRSQKGGGRRFEGTDEPDEWDGDKMPSNHNKQNADFRYAIDELAQQGIVLDKDQQRRLHNAISKRHYGKDQIIEIAESMFGSDDEELSESGGSGALDMSQYADDHFDQYYKKDE